MFADESSRLALYGSCRVILAAVSVELTLNRRAFALEFPGLGSNDASHSVSDLLLARTAGAAKLGIPRASHNPRHSPSVYCVQKRNVTLEVCSVVYVSSYRYSNTDNANAYPGTAIR